MNNFLRSALIISLMALTAANSGLYGDTVRAKTRITAPKVASDKDEQTGREVKVEKGREVELKDEKLKIKFVSLVSDSRCPKDVTCIWAGDAEILLKVRAKGKAKFIHLHTSGRFDQATQFDGYVITLNSLEPYPTSKGKCKSEEYVATLSVQKK